MLKWIFVGLLFSSIASVGTAATDAPPAYVDFNRQDEKAFPEAGRAKEILRHRCFNCHGPNGRGRLSQIDDLVKLVAGGYVKAGAPDDSLLLQRITAVGSRMPPETDDAGQPLAALSAVETKAVRDWIVSLTKASPAEANTDEELLEVVLQDLQRLAEDRWDLRKVRYLVFDAESARKREYKVIADLALNSVSSNPTVRPTVALLRSERILRVWLPNYGWNESQMDQLDADHLLVHLDMLRTYSLTNDPFTRPLLEKFRKLVGSTKILINGLRFLQKVLCEDEVYRLQVANILGGGGRLPDTFDRYLDLISTHEDRARSEYLLLSHSGVALNQRAIQVHPLRYTGVKEDRSIWVTHDHFEGRQVNLFEGIYYPGYSGADGHEIIFELPNGMLAFLAAQNNGRHRELTEAVPQNLAADTRPDRRDPTIRNPTSCFGCHAGGILPARDRGREFYERFGRIPPFALIDAKRETRMFQAQNQRLKDRLKAASGRGDVSLGRLESFCEDRLPRP